MALSSEGAILVKVGTLPGYFTTCSGGETSVDTTEVVNGGDQFTTIIPGNVPKISNVSVSKPFDVETDTELCRKLKQAVGKYRAPITKQPLSRDGVARVKPIVYPDAVLVKVTEPDANWGNEAAAMMELEFAVSRVA